MLTVSYRAYGANNRTIKTGTVSFPHGLPNDEQEMTAELMDAVAADVGEERFETEVVGVKADKG